MSAVLGMGAYALILGGALGVVLLLARRAAVLLPVVVGAAARLAVILVIHAISLSRGEGGFLYLDDRGYAIVGERLSDSWSSVGWVNPATTDFAGSYAVGYPMVVGFVFLLVGPNVLAAKLLNVVFGACSVLFAARIADAIGLGHRRRLVAWMVSLWPTLLWWTGAMMKEELAAALLLGAVLAALRLHRRFAVVGLGLCLTGLVEVRIPGFMAGSLTAIGAVLLLVFRRERVAWAAGARAAAGIALAAGVFLFGFTANSPGAGIRAYQEIATTSTSAPGPGGVRTDGDERPLPIRIVEDIATTYVAPYPWAFDEDTDNWNRGMYPGMWLWYALLPTVIASLVVLRRNSRAMAALLIPVATFAIAGPLLGGVQFRQRSSVEALLLIAAVAGASNWRLVGLRGAVALTLVAVGAGIHTSSLPVVILILLGAAALAVLAVYVGRRWPRTGLPSIQAPVQIQAPKAMM
jgi:uncharacterized membrane protein YuzA (DUF378 family)